jgi:hypothetical protein
LHRDPGFRSPPRASVPPKLRIGRPTTGHRSAQPKIASLSCLYGIYAMRRTVYAAAMYGEFLFIFQKGICEAIE